jgi:nucleoid DNA-binding protein
MTHLELVAHVAGAEELDEKEVRRVLDAAFATIVDEVAGGGKVVVGGFGTFKRGLKRRAPRADRNAPRKHKLMLTPSSTLGEKLDA